MTVGQELLDVPFPEMVYKLAEGIANAQTQLDKNSVDVTKELAGAEIEVVPAITRTVTDDDVTFDAADAIDMSLLQVGLNPTFYQFSETVIEVEMDIKTTTETETSLEVGFETSFESKWSPWSASLSVDFEHNRKFGKEVHGTSKLKTTMVPVPPPPYLFPEVETVDLREPPEPPTPE